MGRKRLDDIDATKGLAIFLVVVGHLVARGNPEGCFWYPPLRAGIYAFHMPLFIFICGLIQSYTQRPVQSLAEYGRFCRKKVVRLVPAWLFFAFVVFMGKYLGSTFMHVDNGVDHWTDFFNVITTPRYSYSSYLWFIYVLLVFYLITPLLYALCRGRSWLLLPFAAALQLVEAPTLFAMSSLSFYALFYSLGLVAGDHIEAFRAVVKKSGWLFLVAMSFLFGWMDPYSHSELFMGLLSLPAIPYVVDKMSAGVKRGLIVLGLYTFSIYLMNTILIGVAKGIMVKVLPWDNFGFSLMVPVLLWAGLYLPIWIKDKIVARSRILSFVIA